MENLIHYIKMFWINFMFTCKEPVAGLFKLDKNIETLYPAIAYRVTDSFIAKCFRLIICITKDHFFIN